MGRTPHTLCSGSLLHPTHILVKSHKIFYSSTTLFCDSNLISSGESARIAAAAAIPEMPRGCTNWTINLNEISKVFLGLASEQKREDNNLGIRIQLWAAGATINLAARRRTSTCERARKGARSVLTICECDARANVAKETLATRQAAIRMYCRKSKKRRRFSPFRCSTEDQKSTPSQLHIHFGNMRIHEDYPLSCKQSPSRCCKPSL